MGIHLAKGDRFTFATASKKIGNSQSVVSNANYSISADGYVTINHTGDYYVWLSSSNTETYAEGTEVINIELKTDGTDWSRDGGLVAKNQNGVSLIASSGNTLSFGGNLDYSLLDAYGKSGYSFVVCLDHTTSSTNGGDVHYTFSGLNYDVIVDKYDGSYSAGNTYTNPTPIAAGGTDSSSFSLTGLSANTPSYICFRITLSPEQVRALITSGTAFTMTISYSFTETAIS